MKELQQFIEENDPLAKVEILLRVFSIEDINSIFQIDIDENYIETLDIYTAYDLIEIYEEEIIKKWIEIL